MSETYSIKTKSAHPNSIHFVLSPGHENCFLAEKKSDDRGNFNWLCLALPCCLLQATLDILWVFAQSPGGGLDPFIHRFAIAHADNRGHTLVLFAAIWQGLSSCLQGFLVYIRQRDGCATTCEKLCCYQAIPEASLVMAT
ncbi:uncharacterized protein N7515_001383 [Penicillium bovifimosum]|uniref:Uncharacterized protein n=1 Tax=Penicillium bovifimosum TaxID=126998 RepID=A0A9W9HBD1_9EURO|nr:uncharacterized protein N7515_001383 [Penicillium bovifimosum]KAJ5142596.1 hypothetical protein N7515_001383 [Penicillium bovifimosum]